MASALNLFVALVSSLEKHRGPYEDIFTVTLVTCRSVGMYCLLRLRKSLLILHVGIGAYLVRLGQRAIQIEGQPIILTGAQAINKLLGREVLHLKSPARWHPDYVQEWCFPT